MSINKLTEVDVNALISSSKEISNSKFNWNNRISSIDTMTKRLSRISREHDGCLDSGIKTLAKLSDRLEELKKEGSIIKKGIATAIVAFIAAENGYSKHTNYDYRKYKLGGGLETFILDNNLNGNYQGNKAVTIAQKELSNKNKSKVGGEKYWKIFFNKNVDWCACFVTWCMKKNGVSNDIVKRSPQVKEIYNHSLNQGTFHSTNSNYKPKAGDLIVWQNKRSHIGIVESYNNGKVTTIEGNTNNDDSNKSRVARHTYTYSNGYGNSTGFISPNYKKNK